MDAIYIGVDFHARQQTICYLKTDLKTASSVGKEARAFVTLRNSGRNMPARRTDIDLVRADNADSTDHADAESALTDVKGC